MKKGDPILYFEKNGQIVSAWHNNKQVTVLSTMHDASETQKRLRSRHDPTGHRNVTKPAMVEDYNAHIGGVDKADQYFQYYRHPHRSANTVCLCLSIYYHSDHMNLYVMQGSIIKQASLALNGTTLHLKKTEINK